MTRYEQEKSASSNVRRGALDTLTSAPQVGLEPTTLRLTVGCSDQLSYWGMVWSRLVNLGGHEAKSIRTRGRAYGREPRRRGRHARRVGRRSERPSRGARYAATAPCESSRPTRPPRGDPWLRPRRPQNPPPGRDRSPSQPA